MRRLVVLVVLVPLVAACGSKDHAAPRLTQTVQPGETPAGPRAGGPASLTQRGATVVGKALLVVRVRGDELIVRNPNGGTLTITHRHPAGARAVGRPGSYVSFTGTRSGTTVTVGSLVVVGS
jgi:hypothetical protein